METIKECPFCGCEELTVTARFIKKYKTWSSIVMCNHCQASGSICGGEESEAEARQTAIENWNRAKRPNPYRMALVRAWNNFWRRVHGVN